MISNRLAFIGLSLACVVAAFGGGYLASRQNTVPVPAAALESTPSSAASTAAVGVADRVEQPAVSGVAPKASQPPAARRTESRRDPQSQTATRTASAARQNLPAPDRAPQASGPSPSAVPPPTSPAGTVDTVAPSVAAVRPVEEAPRAPDPPEKTFIELVVPTNAVIGLQTENSVSSETAHVEDRVEARVMRDVKVGNEVAIPAGAHAIGSVTQVETGGKFKERARLSVRFNTVVLADGTRLPINTETVYREGDPPGDSSAAKVGGGAVAGAILGAILGGGKGAAAGAAAGAGGGAAVVAAGDRKPATMPVGSQFTVRFLSPVTVTLEK